SGASELAYDAPDEYSTLFCVYPGQGISCTGMPGHTILLFFNQVFTSLFPVKNWVFVSFAQLWDAVTLALWVFSVEVNMATTGRPRTKMEHKVLAWLCESIWFWSKGDGIGATPNWDGFGSTLFVIHLVSFWPKGGLLNLCLGLNPHKLAEI
ncbi:hypothetical protein ACJX0J_029457, partial [Zea mays]